MILIEIAVDALPPLAAAIATWIAKGTQRRKESIKQALAARTISALPDFPVASVEYANARINLRNIRRVLAGRGPARS